ncbi:transporter substrate-binding protein [Paenibacillus tyrfis]|uniref:transporter substrate-binding protein n=1 Tax=Paenibacillus tyrfis TaxID=1501230 RepID=UPI0020A19ABA|nr:transporter substrate-binding protein [Paenibacillus tyrfis]MCP1306351.1 transporter substrate-binding protein [Paenibacillus tyrfis]
MNARVGLLFSLTGTTALTERGQCDAAILAIEHFNQNEMNVEAIVRDICSDPAKSAKEADALAKDGVKVFIGCYTSACRKAILPVLEKYGCLLVYPTLYEGRECHSNVFYTGEVPNQQVHVLLDYLTEHFGKRVYCIGTDYIYPRETNQQVRTYLAEKNGSVVGEAYVPFGHQTFYDVLEDIIVKRPDAIFTTLVGQSIIPFYRAYRRMGLNPDHLPIFSPITKETEIAAMGADYGAGHYGSASYFQSLQNEHNLHFVSAFHERFGAQQVISSVMFNTYLGTKMILDSIHETGSLDYRDVFYHLSDKKLETACGTVLVEGDHHHLSRPVKIGRAMPDGQFEMVWDSQRNIAPKPFKEKSREPGQLNEIILESWGRISDEAIVVLSERQHIVYMSKKAEELTRLKEGQLLTPTLLQQIHHAFEVHPYGTTGQQMLLLKPKPSVRSSAAPFQFDRIQTLNPEYQLELEVAKLASQSCANVLITGETGTGKEVLVQAIHQQSERKHGPLVAVNTGLLPRELIASEMFGYIEGAFTGAKKGGSIGKFEAANDGTLFLDEIGDMPLDLQVVLLRAIESKRIMRLGENKEHAVNVRIIAATNRNLQEEIAYSGSFRSDLFYRLNVLSITIPPLRERPEDVEHLSREFLREFQAVHGDGPDSLSDEALQALIQYPWPGNIRELRNVMERAYLLAGRERSAIRVEHLPRALKGYYQRKPRAAEPLKQVERRMIEQVLSETKTITEASKVLGITRSTLYRKLKEFQMTP